MAIAPTSAASAFVPIARAPVPFADVEPLPMANVAPPVAVPSGIAAQAVPAEPQTATANAVKRNKIFKPVAVFFTVVDFVCPFANSDATTKAPTASLQTILKILFIDIPPK